MTSPAIPLASFVVHAELHARRLLCMLIHDPKAPRSVCAVAFFFFSSRRRHTRSLCDWSSDVCSSDLCYVNVSNGAQVFLGEPVAGIDVADECVYVHTGGGGAIAASMVVNAAGLWADEVARMAGDDSFTLTPRRGQFIVVEEDHGVSQIILPVPNRISKGILVTPIVFGGVLLGPTAEEVDAKTDLATTAQGMHQIREGISKLVPVMAGAESVRQFAGLRAVSSTGDYIYLASSVRPGNLHVTRIHSSELSYSPAIGRYVSGLVRDELSLSQRNHFMDE